MLSWLFRNWVLSRLLGRGRRRGGRGYGYGSRGRGGYGYGSRGRGGYGYGSRGRGGLFPFPHYSTRTRRGSRVGVSGCCLPIPLALGLGMMGAVRALARR